MKDNKILLMFIWIFIVMLITSFLIYLYYGKEMYDFVLIQGIYYKKVPNGNYYGIFDIFIVPTIFIPIGIILIYITDINNYIRKVIKCCLKKRKIK